GSLLKSIPASGEVKDQLVALGVITAEGRELLGGCVVVPIPDPLTAEWTTLYGRGVKTARHCYLSGPLRGVLNFQAARSSEEVILTESVFDALSFLQAGIATVIPIYGTNGFTGDHLDLLKRERVKRVILALDSDEAGRKGTDALKGRLQAAGLAVRVASFPAGIKDANELLVSRNGDVGAAFRRILDEAEPRPTSGVLPAPLAPGAPSPLSEKVLAPAEGVLILARDGLRYEARVQSILLGRLRVTVKVTRGDAFHVDTLDLYASRSRCEFARRAGKVFGVDLASIEAALLVLVVEAEKTSDQEKAEPSATAPPLSDAEREEALAFLKRSDLLDQVARDIDALGFVGEEMVKRLLYLV
ncbi:MAG: toprim domain-containing protein, partial [Vicinamibacteria bacterium]